jgi:D-alanine-D-alanine ligase
MKVAIIYNKDMSGVINRFGMQNKERYNPKTVKLIAEALEKGGHNVRVIDGNMHVIESLQEFMSRVVEGERLGMVFNMAYGIQGESRYTHLPAMLEMLGIPYVGSDPEGHALALDKVIAKMIMQQNGIPTPKFWVFSTGEEDMESVEYPVVVKPKMEAVSYGLEIVNCEADLRKAVKYTVEEFQQQALVEQFIRGREFVVGLLGNGEPEAFPVLEIDLGGDPNAIQSAMDKLNMPREKICPANISQKLSDEMIRFSKEAFRILHLKDFARVDIRIDENNNIYILEINSMASLGKTGSYVHAASKAGYDYIRLINRILDIAAVRYFSEDFAFTSDNNVPNKKKLPVSVRVRTYIRSKQENVEKLLTKMVNINTYVRNVDGVNELGKFMSKQLKSLRFEYSSIPQAEVGNILFFSNTKEDKIDVLFLAHLDNSIPFKRHVYFNQKGHKLFGTGIWDNKGGLVILITALRALRFVRILRTMKIGILLTTDENLQGRISSDIIKDISSRAKIVIGLSGAQKDGSLITSRSGAAVYNCQMNLVKAKDAVDVAKANSKFTRLLSKLTKLSDEKEGVIVSPREVKINSNISNLFSHGEAVISVRFNNPQQVEIYDNKIHSLVKKVKSDKIQVQISGETRRNPMMKNEETIRIFKKIKDVADKIDIRILEEHRWSSANICFVDSKKPKIDGLGSPGDVSKDNEEYILQHSLLDRATLLALLLIELKKEDE